MNPDKEIMTMRGKNKVESPENCIRHSLIQLIKNYLIYDADGV